MVAVRGKKAMSERCHWREKVVDIGTAAGVEDEGREL
jgi:hypothetical protein